MKLFQVVLAALALAGCSSPSSTHTVQVTGVPDEVARFVAAEKGRDGSADVAYRTGASRAVFSVPNPDAQDEMTRRATAARLGVETRSTSWTFTADP